VIIVLAFAGNEAGARIQEFKNSRIQGFRIQESRSQESGFKNSTGAGLKNFGRFFFPPATSDFLNS
jgi:hypothetical protein